VTSTEIEPEKHRHAEANVQAAGLADVARVLVGDARQTLRPVPGPIDLVFLDAWKDLYLPVLEILRPKLRDGALVIADNANFPEARPYLDRVRRGRDFASMYLPGPKMECSFYLAQPRPQADVEIREPAAAPG